MPVGKATIDWDGYYLIVRFPYDEKVISDFKAAIPQHARRWDAGERVWSVQTIYLDQVVEVLEAADFAIRDYTGDDSKSRARQAEHRASAEARAADLDHQKQAKERERAKHDAEAQARKERAEQARKQRTSRGNANSFREQYEQEFPHETSDPKYWREKFFSTWPECNDRHFQTWWLAYSFYGRDEANRRFSEAYAQEKARERAYLRTSGRQRFGDDFWRTFGNRAAPPPPSPARVDHYAIIGMVSTCTYDQAKIAYRQAALKWHPDRNPEAGAEAMMKRVNRAWDSIKAERGWK